MWIIGLLLTFTALMRPDFTRKPRLSKFAYYGVAMLAVALFSPRGSAAEPEPTAHESTETALKKTSREPRSKSSQALGADTKRPKVTLPTPADTAPDQIETKGLRGKASFYGPKFQGRKTATGEIFNNKLFTAASNLFPLGTLVAVKRPDTNLCVVVKVNDRMHPKHQSRVIDLSKSAASYLNMVRDGVVKVQVMRVPADAVEGNTINCEMGFELEEDCPECAPPLQFNN